MAWWFAKAAQLEALEVPSSTVSSVRTTRRTWRRKPALSLSRSLCTTQCSMTAAPVVFAASESSPRMASSAEYSSPHQSIRIHWWHQLQAPPLLPHSKFVIYPHFYNISRGIWWSKIKNKTKTLTRNSLFVSSSAPHNTVAHHIKVCFFFYREESSVQFLQPDEALVSALKSLKSARNRQFSRVLIKITWRKMEYEDLMEIIKVVDNFDKSESESPDNEESNAETGWNLIPENVLVRIFKHLSVKEILNASAVCKRWNFISSDSLLWKHKFTNDFKVGKIPRRPGKAFKRSNYIIRLNPSHTIIPPRVWFFVA